MRRHLSQVEFLCRFTFQLLANAVRSLLHAIWHALTVKRHTKKQRRPVFLAEAMVLLISTGIALSYGILLGYRQFATLSATPDLPTDPGEARLVFDRPGVEAVLEVKIDEIFTGRTEVNYRITIDEPYPADRVRFSLVLSGATKTDEEPIYIGGPPTGTNGCWVTMDIFPAEDAIGCRSINAEPDGRPADRSDTRIQVVDGYVTLGDSGAKFAEVNTVLRASLHRQAGKRTHFRLPAFGTVYIPAGYRDEVALKYGGSTAYVPQDLNMVIEFRPLEVNERLEAVSPEPYAAGELTWIEVDRTTVKAQGSVVDVNKEEQAQRDLFILGVLLGAAVGIVQFVVSAIWKISIEILSLARDGNAEQS